MQFKIFHQKQELNLTYINTISIKVHLINNNINKCWIFVSSVYLKNKKR